MHKSQGICLVIFKSNTGFDFLTKNHVTESVFNLQIGNLG